MGMVYRIMRSKLSPENAGLAQLTRYYEHDGMLRAYANRAMFLALLFALIAMGSLGFAIYVRVQPPTVIRVDKDGNALVVAGPRRRQPATAIEGTLTTDSAGAASAAPTDMEGKAMVRHFLDHYLSYTPESAARNLAEALNMMTVNLRSFTMAKLREDDTLGKIQQDHIISELRIRSIESAKSGPWNYVVFAVKEIHRVRDGSEATDRIVGQYNLRLVEEKRSELNPSGLLVAEYSEKQMLGERDNGLKQRSELDK